VEGVTGGVEGRYWVMCVSGCAQWFSDCP